MSNPYEQSAALLIQKQQDRIADLEKRYQVARSLLVAPHELQDALASRVFVRPETPEEFDIFINELIKALE